MFFAYAAFLYACINFSGMFLLIGGEGLADDAYCLNFLSKLAPHSWPSSTLQQFPQNFVNFFVNIGPAHLNNKKVFKQLVDHDYMKIWRSKY